MSDPQPAMPKVVLTHWVHREVLDLLAPHCQVVANPTRETWPREEVLEKTADAQAIMVFMPDTIDEAFLEACPGLKVVGAALKGYDNFDVAACTRRGIWFTIVPDLLTIPTAELALGLILGITRNLLPGDDHVRSGQFNGWRPHLYGSGLGGKVLGIIGMGAVGQALVQRLVGFEMETIYHDANPAPAELEEALGLRQVGLPEILSESDILVPLVPLNDQTRHLINITALDRMKRGAYLVNVCRGSVVDEAAVAAALRRRSLAGYAADVFEMEDWALEARPRTIHPDLLADRRRTLFTPHLGSAVDEVRREIALDAARNILEVLSGETPHGAINSPQG